MAETLMGAEADCLCGAPYGRSGPQRVNQRNGYRDRRWDTRVGSIELAIPRLRKGSYYPEWLLGSQRRSERSLVQVVTECHVRGVSTRRVEGLVQAMGLTGMSKSRVSDMAKELDEVVEGFRHRPLDQGAGERPGSGGHPGALDLRPARCQGGLGPAWPGGGASGETLQRSGQAAGRGGRGPPGLQRLPQVHLAPGCGLGLLTDQARQAMCPGL